MSMIAKTERNKQADVVLAFWELAGEARWFTRNDAFDANVRQHFSEQHFAAARGEYADWMTRAEDALALLLLLDQIPRNAFRGSAHAYATDGLALFYAKQAITRGFDQQVSVQLRLFFYLPFEHAEELQEQARSVTLITALGEAETTRYALEHQQIIQRFGRFPHRNAVLGRETTVEEQQFLDEGGFAG
ncbi:DUF924 family protein [Xanthomonas campestris pv. raphani]|uniref:DUF924 family protein n=1 Tax=Xanthomonas campestris TaxID=339 RepID=UPI001E399D33|nr:DUF924 family protein [Xanthomonas campestris]MEB2181255.1 DUF924 family protein [Xanthomonas campestris pv. campestris]MCC8692171.1 DUF924 family protein [Xanthomonas campestris]MEA9656696.1 DUF924 family protein [Xanthomonas campestris pv. raphani]MEA9673316.1 DUF924 family protein [Xanthomonas campestris pv. raphani]MEA9707785.1 DUF924 family protein [Xanthomonas campestris pv. raphani]